MRWVIGVVAVLSSCSLLTNLGDLGDGGAADTSSTDVVTDAGARCNKSSLFGSAVAVSELRDPAGAGELAARLTADELDIFYTHIDSSGVVRTYTASRGTRDDVFGASHELAGVRGSGSNDSYPSVTAEGTTYYVQSDSDAGLGFGIYTASRIDRTVTFTNYARVTTLGSTDLYHPYVSPDGKSALFLDLSTDGGNGGHLVIAAATQFVGGAFYDAAPVVGGVNDAITSRIPVVTSDLLTLYFATNRNDAGEDIWTATRTAPNTDWGSAKIVPELSTPNTEQPSWISPDECVMYLTRNVKEGSKFVSRIHRAVRSP